MIGETYECDVCHGTFTKVRSDAEAVAEMHATWKETSDPGIVCDDCFRAIVAWARREGGMLR